MQIVPNTGAAVQRADLAEGGFAPQAYRSGIKPILDAILVIMILPIILPIIAVLCIVTRLDGGPGFFGHRRVGRNGKTFLCWKIRTMIVDAEAALKDHLAKNPEAAAEWASNFKLTHDPRITRLGKFLRRTSLDELPQLWNVIRGDMSFVGPRPVTQDEIENYRGYEWCYFTVKPGITGLWQVSGRNDVDYASRVQLDAAYASSMSLRRDLRIILKTAGAVLSRTGK